MIYKLNFGYSLATNDVVHMTQSQSAQDIPEWDFMLFTQHWPEVACLVALTVC